jgi:predicted Fe-S protein YdhL (DUF1289 family)
MTSMSTDDMEVAELRRPAPTAASSNAATPDGSAPDASTSAAVSAQGPAEQAPPTGKASDAHRDAASIASHSLAPTDSPCVAVCSTLYDDICRGCGRTAMEVANWVFLDDDEKRDVWLRIKAQGYPRRKG